MKRQLFSLLAVFFCLSAYAAAALATPQVTAVTLSAPVAAGSYVVVFDDDRNGNGVWVNPGASSGDSLTDPALPAGPGGANLLAAPADMFGTAESGYGQLLLSVTSDQTAIGTELGAIATNLPTNANLAIFGSATGPVNKDNIELERAIPAGTSVTFTINMNGELPHLIAVMAGESPVVGYDAATEILTLSLKTFATTNAAGETFSSLAGFMIFTNPALGTTPLRIVAQTNHWVGDIFPLLPGWDTNAKTADIGGEVGTITAKCGTTVVGPTGESRNINIFFPDETIPLIFGADNNVLPVELAAFANEAQEGYQYAGDILTLSQDSSTFSGVTGTKASFTYTFASPVDLSIGVGATIPVDGQWSNYSSSVMQGEWSGSIVNDMAQAADGTIIYATATGAAEFDGTNWRHYEVNDNYLWANVGCVAIDAAGNKWFGLPLGKIRVLRPDGEWETHNPTGAAVNVIDFDQAGHVWVGTEGEGVATYDGVSWTVFNAANSDLPGDTIKSLAVAPTGEIFVGVWGSGLWSFDGSAWVSLSSGDSLAAEVADIVDITFDNSGNAWFVVYAGGGPYRYSPADGVVTDFGAQMRDALGDGNTSYFYAVAFDPKNNNIWVSQEVANSTGYVASSADGGTTWTVYSTADGLISNEVRARSILPAADGGVWFGTFHGVSRFGEQMTANFNADLVGGTAPLAVQFADASVGEANQWHWDFGDGLTSTEQSPLHSYMEPGNYTVTLTISNDPDSDTDDVSKTLVDFITITVAADNQVVLSEGFEGVTIDPELILASVDQLGWSAVDSDGDALSWMLYMDDSLPHSGSNAAIALPNVSDPVVANDDWLISTPIIIPAGNKADFSFWAAGPLSEDFNVKLSTSDTELASFDVTLAEVRGFTGGIDETDSSFLWQKFAYDLSAYAGQTVYLAIQYVSNGEVGLFIDDLQVSVVPPVTDGSWQIVDPGIEVRGFYWVQFINADTGWASGTDATMLKTTDGGATWTSQSMPAEFPAADSIYAVYFVDEDYGWAVGGTITSAYIMHTTDGGTTWVMQTSATQARIGSMYFVDRNNGWLCGDNGTIQHTTDGGENWSLQTTPLSNHVIDIHFIDANVGWAGTQYRKILHTTDGGATWVAQNSGLPTPTFTYRNFGDMDFIDANNGWMVGMEGSMAHTTDGGLTWTPQDSNGIQYFTDVDFVDANHGWVIGIDGLIMVTEDGGATWQVQASGTEETFLKVAFTDRTSGWAVGTNSLLLHYTSNTAAVLDSDGDGVIDVDDPFPTDNTEWLDTDGDGLGNNTDTDDDGDGMLDTWEVENGLNPLYAGDAASDLDGDGLSNLYSFQNELDPRVSSLAISGRVIGVDGSPLANVWVEASSASLQVQAGNVSDAEGNYEIKAAAADDYRVSVPGGGIYMFTVYDRASAWADATPVDLTAGSASGIDFVLSTGLSLSGSVSGLNPGEVIRVEAWSEDSGGLGIATVVGSTSGTDEFVIVGLPAADDYRLNFLSEDHPSGYVLSSGLVGSWNEAQTFNSGASDIVIIAADGFSISGTVSGLVSGDHFWISAISDATGCWQSVQLSATGSEESFTITGLAPASDYRILLQSDKYCNGSYNGSIGGVASALVAGDQATLLDVTGGNVGGINILVSSGYSISGTVSGLAQGDKAMVWTWSKNSGASAIVWLVGDGADQGYTLAGLRDADDYSVIIIADGYVQGYYGGPDVSQVVRWQYAYQVSTPAVDIDLAITPGHTISGTITGLQEEGAVSVGVASEEAEYTGSVSFKAGSGDAGYAINGLPAATDYVVTFRAVNYREKQQSGVDSSTDPTVNFTATVGNYIEGTIYDVGVYNWVKVVAVLPSTGDSREVSVQADATGHVAYRIDGLTSEDGYNVRAEKDGKVVFYGDSSSLTGALAVNLAASDASNVDINFDSITEFTISGYVSGLVANTDQVRVDVWDESTGVWNGSQRHGNGAFSLTLPVGNYKLALYAEGYVDTYFVDVNTVATEVSAAVAINLGLGSYSVGTLTMPQGYAYEGKVYLDANGDGVGDSGEELSEAHVEVSGDNGISRGDTTGRGGLFHLDGLPTYATYTVMVRSQYGTCMKTLAIDGADVAAADIVLGALMDDLSGEISGTVTDSNGDIISNAIVKFLDANGVFINAVQTDVNGQYRYSGLTGGVDYTVDVDADGNGSSEDSAQVPVTGGESTTHDVSVTL